MAGIYKIMIADDFPILREDLAEMIGEQPDMEVVGSLDRQGDRGSGGKYGL